MHPSFLKRLRIVLALASVAALDAGCGNNNLTSGYGILWTTLQAEPSNYNYTAYIVTIDSVTLTRSDGVEVTALGTPEVVDFTQLTNIAEMWGSGSVPVGTYISATITLDYTNAVIAVMVNGKPQQATLIDPVTHTTPTTYAITVNFDPQNPPTITSTYASTSAQRLALDFDLAASGTVDFATSPATVNPRPFFTIGAKAADTRLIRVRGPIINSSADVQSYSVYVRPFYDEANNIGSLSLFSQPNTVYTINGRTYVGSDGLQALSVLSAGITITAGYAQLIPDYNPANQAAAGTFYLVYVVGASTLEDEYTEGISGDVVARNGDTLTLQSSTLFLNTADTFTYEVNPTQVLLGSGTIVTADDNTTLKNLNSSDVTVGQHITARGLYSVNSAGTVVIDSTGNTGANTGSVRLQTTALWGPLISATDGSLVMNIESVNGWPSGDFDFSIAGVAPSSFLVDSGSTPLSATSVGEPVWVDGFFIPMGTNLPDFTAVSVNNENSVQVAGTQAGGGVAYRAGPSGLCGADSQVCDPASLQILWGGDGTDAPFAVFSTSGFSIDLTNPHLSLAVLRIGPEVIDLATLPTSPLLVPTSAATDSVFAPRFTYGNPVSATTTPTVTDTEPLATYGRFADFAAGVASSIAHSHLALQLTARGVYDRTSNTFTATSIDFVL